MLLSIPKDLKMGLLAEGYGGFPHWPPYFPKVYNTPWQITLPARYHYLRCPMGSGMVC